MRSNVEVGRTDLLMVLGRMMFGEVVSAILSAFFPQCMKLSLSDAIAHPVKTHIDGFGSALFDSVVGDACSGSVVGSDWSWWLGMAEFFKAGANGASIFTIKKSGTEFGFSGAGDDLAHNVAKNVNGTIGTRAWSVAGRFAVGEFSEAEETGCARAGLGFGEAGRVAVDGKTHAAAAVSEDCIGMGGGAVKESGDRFHGLSSGVGLLGGDGAERGQHGEIDGSGAEEEDTNDFLDSADAVFVEWWRSVVGRCKLNLGTALNGLMGMRGMLRFGGLGMRESLEGAVDVAGHGEISAAVLVVPSNGDATVARAFPVFLDNAALFQNIEKVMHIVVGDTFDTEIINH